MRHPLVTVVVLTLFATACTTAGDGAAPVTSSPLASTGPESDAPSSDAPSSDAPAQSRERTAAPTWTFPGAAVFPEGIAAEPSGRAFYAGSTRDGTVYRGDAGDPAAGMQVFLPPGTDGRTTVTGLAVDGYGRLFVAGRDSNRFFVYDAADGELLARREPPAAERTLLNDVAITDDAAYVTDSFRPTLFRIPLAQDDIGPIEPWLDLDGTAIRYAEGFNLNGIVASDDGSHLLTVQYNTGQLFRIGTEDRTVTRVELDGVRLRTGDGLVLDGTRLYVVLGGPGEVVTVALDEDLAGGEVVARTSREEWRAPTTIAPAGDRLLIVNSQLDMAGGGGAPSLPFTVTAFPVPEGA